MTPGDDAAPGLATRGERNDILLGGGVSTNSTASILADEVCDASELVVAGGLLSVRDVECAQRLIDLAPPEAYRHPVVAFVMTVSAALVFEDVVPSPLSVVTYAMQRGIPIPERQTPVAALARIAADSSMCGDPGWAARQVAINHHRRVIAAAAERISHAAWSDHAELVPVVKREIAAIERAVEAVTE